MRRLEREEEILARREERRKNARTSQNSQDASSPRHKAGEPLPVDEDQITINLNTDNQKSENEEENKIKINLFNRKQKEESPDSINSNIYKQTAKAAEMNAAKQEHSSEDSLFATVEQEKDDKTKTVLQLEHTLTVEEENYEYPPVEILGKGSKKNMKGGAKALTEKATKLQRTLYSFGVSAKVENISVGPAITRYELKPAEGVRVSK